MSNGLNKVQLIGRLGQDAETKTSAAGSTITTISVATSSSRKDKEGNKQEKTEWHRVKLFGKLGEIAGEYLKKGSQVYIEGRLSYGSYDKEGVTVYTTDILADEMQMLGSARESAATDSAPADSGYASRSVSAEQEEAAPADALPF